MAKKTGRIENLEAEIAQGLNAFNQFTLLQEAFLELKANTMDKFESEDTLNTDELQEVHRTYKNVCYLEKFFIIRIKRGQDSEKILNSHIKEKR